MKLLLTFFACLLLSACEKKQQEEVGFVGPCLHMETLYATKAEADEARKALDRLCRHQEVLCSSDGHCDLVSMGWVD